MTEEKYTRCPSCKTVFRVTDAQLALRDGMVRCGHCQTIFDGVAELISLAPVVRSEEDFHDEALLGPPTVTLRSSRSLQPSTPEPVEVQPSEDPDESSVATPTHTHTATQSPTHAQTQSPAHATTRTRTEADDEFDADVDYEHRFAWDKPKKAGKRRTWIYALAVPLLLLLLASQLLYHFRDALAAHWPMSRPALENMCRTLGCEVRPLRDVGALSIDASDLQVDPAHKGLLILTATVRNRAGYALAYPYLELTLTDSQDQVVVRRAFAPGEYLSGTVDVRAGLPGNGEAALKLFIDASATTQAGYRLYLFYP